MAGDEHAAVEQPDRGGGVAALLADQVLEVEASGVPVAPPVGEQERREAGVADRAHVGAAVGEARDGVRVGEHLPNRLQVALGVVQERQVEQGVATALDHPVVGPGLGCHAGPGRVGGDAVVGARLVVGRVGEQEQALGAAEQAAAGGARRGEHTVPGSRIRQVGDPLRQRQQVDGGHLRQPDERVHRAVEAEQQAHGSGRRPGPASRDRPGSLPRAWPAGRGTGRA